MKFGYRKPSIKKSIKARTTGKIKRATNSAINPFYGKKGMGYINDPKKAIYNKIYNKTTFGTSDILKKIDNNNNNKEGDIKMENKNKEENATNKKNKKFFKDKKNIAITILSILLFCVLCIYCSTC